MNNAIYTVSIADWATDLPDLREIREQVFIVEQNVPAIAEWDDVDAQSLHVIARDIDGRAIGTGRLNPQHTIGRVAVISRWRGRGVGAALVKALLDGARARGSARVELHSQTHAINFYERLGFVAFGDEYLECDIAHRSMVIALTPAESSRQPVPATIEDDNVLRVRTRDELIDAHQRLLAAARYDIAILTHDLDPGVLDEAGVLAELRRIALSGRRARVRILVREPSMRAAALVALAQRLPSAIAVRSPVDQEDRALSLGMVLTDCNGYLQRNDALRFDGHGSLDAPARQRTLQSRFDAMWERAEPSAEIRPLAI
ncbi:MAG: GNAT family N-acetyltransferase [Dokdonella sp.]